MVYSVEFADDESIAFLGEDRECVAISQGYRLQTVYAKDSVSCGCEQRSVRGLHQRPTRMSDVWDTLYPVIFESEKPSHGPYVDNAIGLRY